MAGKSSNNVKRSKSMSSRKKSKTPNSDDENFCSPKKKKTKLKLNSVNAENKGAINNVRKYPSCNILKYYSNYEMGLPCQKYKKPLKNLIINYCKTFQLYKVEAPFDRRVTYLVWHPINPKLLSVTSHGGDVILYNYEQDISSASMIKGVGHGGSVQSMKFDPLNPIQIYIASMEGKFQVLNFHTKERKQFLETNDINRWYVSLDVNVKNNLMVAGDTKGNLTILTLEGQVIDFIQLHEKNFKVNHAEFNKNESWLLCTSSTDGTLKLWDIRNFKSDSKGKVKPLRTIQHEKPINAAYFSLTDSCRLLTTDQKDIIKIYRGPLWNLETIIHHPHRQFQHLTPIRAYWHPLDDIVFVGRYPDEDFPGYHENELRTIDFFDADTGELLYQHSQSGVNGILSLNRFNILGDALASSYGSRFMVWKPNFRHLEKLSKKEFDKKKSNDSYFGKNGDSSDDSSNDDDDDNSDGKVDWSVFLKNQMKGRKSTKKTKKV